MKRLIKIFLLSLCLVLVSCGKEASIEEARVMLSRHLIERYREEFEIGFGGRRSFKIGDREKSWYEFSIKPKRYIGTPKEYDSYYKAVGEIEIKKSLFKEKLELGGDNYNLVLFKECANEFYLPKLKELFGENVLPVLEVTGEYSEKTGDFMESVKKTKALNQNLYIKGGIYIFGRVENDEDRERYRSEIYKFIDFMKETGTFEYVDLEFYISDERIFSDEFYNNLKLQAEMRKFKNYIEPEGRKKILDKVNESYKITNKNIILERIDNLNRSNIDNEFYGIYWLVSKVYSPKYIKSQRLDSKIKEYNKISDVEFSVEGYRN